MLPGPGLSSTSPDKSSNNLKWGGGCTLSQVFILNPDLNQLSVIVSVHCTLDHVTTPSNNCYYNDKLSFLMPI